jgi:hypothetical protein
MTTEIGNNVLFELIKKNEACMVSRFGSTELDCVNFYIEKRTNKKEAWPEFLKYHIFNSSGVYPNNDETMDKFCELYLDLPQYIDMIGLWNVGEEKIKRKFSKQIQYVHLQSLEAYYFSNPWTRILDSKKVLLIHPFESSIIEQFSKREFLFENKSVLPEFELITLKSVQSLGLADSRFKDWFEALEYMKKQVSIIDFDIALIGAGAYGMPLAAYIKLLGKQAIHIGGSLQILFGIKGVRWDKHLEISKLYNDYWIRPSEEETPKTEKLLEDGAYW